MCGKMQIISQVARNNSIWQRSQMKALNYATVYGFCADIFDLIDLFRVSIIDILLKLTSTRNNCVLLAIYVETLCQ